MPPLPQDTIVALATPSGPGARAIVRLSGPDTAAAVRQVFDPAEPLPGRNRLAEGRLSLPDLRPVPAALYYWRRPASYTGQDMAELHLLSSPPLVEALVARLLQAGCRAAGPGELTMRAFLSGKLDLTRAEAVHAVISAGSRNELRQALGQLAGGVAQPLQALRDDLLNLLADVEAGLDFADEDIQFVDAKELLLRLGKAMAQVTLVGKQLDSRSLAGQPFRVALAGRPNAGKSSLFNALSGGRALVSEEPGTTRDYLVQRLAVEGGTIELTDTPGWQEGGGSIERQAQQLGRARQEEADLILLCVPAGEAPTADELRLTRQEQPPVVPVATKCDLAPAAEGWLATSAARGRGLADVRRLLAARLRERAEPALAPSASRCKHHVAACLEHLRRAHAVVLEQEPAEILALELREALEELGQMVGAVYTDDLLDRVFSRFCIGK
jgi:tRNA modification GTPase